MNEEVKAIRMEIHYGMVYLGGTITEKSENLNLAISQLSTARSFLDRFLVYATSGTYNPYPNETNVDNIVIEKDQDRVDSEHVHMNTAYDKVQHIKFMLSGISALSDKIFAVRSKPRTIKSQRDSLMAMMMLDSALRSVESAYCFLGEELRAEGLAHPEKYKAVETVSPAAAVEEKSEEVSKTDEIMENRAGSPAITEADSKADLDGTPRPDNPSPEATAAQAEEDPDRPLTGADFLPGGRAYKDPNAPKEEPKAEEPASTEAPAPGNVESSSDSESSSSSGEGNPEPGEATPPVEGHPTVHSGPGVVETTENPEPSSEDQDQNPNGNGQE